MQEYCRLVKVSPGCIYLFSVSNENTIAMYKICCNKICWKLTIKTPEQHQSNTLFLCFHWWLWTSKLPMNLFSWKHFYFLLLLIKIFSRSQCFGDNNFSIKWFVVFTSNNWIFIPYSVILFLPHFKVW